MRGRSRARAVERAGRALGLRYLGRRPVADAPYDFLASDLIGARAFDDVVAGTYRGTALVLFDVGRRTGGMIGVLGESLPGPELVLAGYSSPKASVAIVEGSDHADARVSEAQWRWLERHGTFEYAAVRPGGICILGRRQSARELPTLATWLHTYHTVAEK